MYITRASYYKHYNFRDKGGESVTVRGYETYKVGNLWWKGVIQYEEFWGRTRYYQKSFYGLSRKSVRRKIAKQLKEHKRVEQRYYDTHEQGMRRR